MLVYRDVNQPAPTEPLLRELRARSSEPRDGAALLLAGSLECALADAGAPSRARAEQLSDALADAWVGAPGALAAAQRLLSGLDVPATLSFTRPEGFAFYALDPARFRALARTLARSVRSECAVIGLRSIGTTLSAVVRAELALSGVRCARTTVRPTGHPFDRSLTWSADDRGFLARFGPSATYVVVDEGPGLSGSTLLAAAEAVERTGVACERIRILCSHAPVPEQLLAADAAKRWARFAVYAAGYVAPPEGTRDLSGGLWRRASYPSEASWPPSWIEQERVKYRAPGGELIKFEGFSPYDEGALQRATVLADAGWSPKVRRTAPGFLAFEWLEGRPLDCRADRHTMPDLLGRYIAFRASALPAPVVSSEALEAMARANVRESLNVELPRDFALEVRKIVQADNRLMPHEWVRTGDRIWKTDAADHADDHLYPGSCDVAWDLAGATVEWALDEEETHRLLSEYTRLSGDHEARGRLAAYAVAYASFRLGVATFAARNGGEAGRWALARARYEHELRRALAGLNPRLPCRTRDSQFHGDSRISPK